MIIFSRGRVRVHPEFKIGDEILEVVSDFLYLGIRLNYNNKMRVAQKDLYDRASRAMFSLLKKCNTKNIPLDIMIDLFDKLILPIITYGCEMWGFGNNDLVRKLQLKYYKIVLKLRQSTPSQMIFGEIGKHPLDVTIKNRIMNFWFRLVEPQNNRKLSAIVYKCLYQMYKHGIHESLYVKNIRKCLIDAGYPYLWETHDVSHLSKNQFKAHIKRHTQDMHILEWHNELANSPIYDSYRIFKTEFCAEKYISLLPFNCVISLIRFRTTNNLLPINVLRYNHIDREDRICRLCNTGEVGNEHHFLFSCAHFQDKRRECIKITYLRYHNHNAFKELFNSTNKGELLKLKHFIDYINNELK